MAHFILTRKIAELNDGKNTILTTGTNLKEALTELRSLAPGLAKTLLTNNYEPRPFLTICVEGEVINSEFEMCLLNQSTSIHLFNAVAGG